MGEESRSDAHGEAMNNAGKAENAADLSVVHCHDCWKYTDDMRREGDLTHEAAMIIANGGTLSVENSSAFKAADEYLAARFKAAARAIALAPADNPWKL